MKTTVTADDFKTIDEFAKQSNISAHAIIDSTISALAAHLRQHRSLTLPVTFALNPPATDHRILT